jgi:four helix bundle protein
LICCPAEQRHESCNLAPDLDRATLEARSATAVAANYRATSRARSTAEFLAKLTVVAEESDETVFWLEFAARTGLGNEGPRTALLAEGRELRAIFAASCRTVRRTSSSDPREFRNVREMFEPSGPPDQ